MKTIAANTIGTTNILNISREIKSLNSFYRKKIMYKVMINLQVRIL